MITSLKLDFPSCSGHNTFLKCSSMKAIFHVHVLYTIATVADIWDFGCHIEKKRDQVSSILFLTFLILLLKII